MLRGFDVRILLPEKDEKHLIFGKVEAALELLHAHDARRFEYLRRDLWRISITGLPAASAQCLAAIHMCVLDEDYVVAATTTPEDLAQTLVHEGAHARLLRAGFGYDEAIRAQVERVCVGQEVAFARRLPGGDALVASAEARLDYPDGYFSNVANRRREIAQLANLGRPGRLMFWLARIFGKIPLPNRPT